MDITNKKFWNSGSSIWDTGQHQLNPNGLDQPCPYGLAICSTQDLCLSLQPALFLACLSAWQPFHFAGISNILR